MRLSTAAKLMSDNGAPDRWTGEHEDAAAERSAPTE